MKRTKRNPRRLVTDQPAPTLYRQKFKKQILTVCRTRFVTRKEISERLGKPMNTVRMYLYQMARSGELKPLMPLGTKNGQAYKSAK